MRRNSRNWPIALLVVSMFGFGCAFGELRFNDPLDREYSLESMQKRYTDLVRFSNFEAAADYVDREQQQAYLAGFPRDDALRFLDYESQPVHINLELTHALVRVVYTAYSPWTLMQVEIVEHQEWRRPKGIANAWTVRSEFKGLEPYLRVSQKSAGL